MYFDLFGHSHKASPGPISFHLSSFSETGVAQDDRVLKAVARIIELAKARGSPCATQGAPGLRSGAVSKSAGTFDATRATGIGSIHRSLRDPTSP